MTASPAAEYDHDYARWDPTISLPPGATAASYESAIDGFLQASQQLYIDHAREARDRMRQRDRILGSMEAVWKEFPAISPGNIKSQGNVISQYGRLLTSKSNHGATLGYETSLTADEAAAHLAAVSILGQSIGIAITFDSNNTLQRNVALAGEYLQDNLELLTRPDGIFGFSDKFLFEKFGITRQEILSTEQGKKLPTHGWIPAPLAVLAADVMHRQNPIRSHNGSQQKVVRAVMRAARRFYDYTPPTHALSEESTLHVLAECLVIEAHDFASAPEEVKRGLAMRMQRSARQGNISRADQLPSKRAADMYIMCMDYYRENRLNDFSEKLQNLRQGPRRLLEWLGF